MFDGMMDGDSMIGKDSNVNITSYDQWKQRAERAEVEVKSVRSDFSQVSTMHNTLRAKVAEYERRIAELAETIERLRAEIETQSDELMQSYEWSTLANHRALEIADLREQYTLAFEAGKARAQRTMEQEKEIDRLRGALQHAYDVVHRGDLPYGDWLSLLKFLGDSLNPVIRAEVSK